MKCSKGFTLIEVLVAVTLSSIIILILNTLIMGYFKMYTSIYDKHTVKNEIEIIFKLFNEVVNTSNLENKKIKIEKGNTNIINTNNTNYIGLTIADEEELRLESTDNKISTTYKGLYTNMYKEIKSIDVKLIDNIIIVNILTNTKGSYEKKFILVSN